MIERSELIIEVEGLLTAFGDRVIHENLDLTLARVCSAATSPR